MPVHSTDIEMLAAQASYWDDMVGSATAINPQRQARIKTRVRKVNSENQ